jgi:flagellar hook-basal body complex protein FliE
MTIDALKGRIPGALPKIGGGEAAGATSGAAGFSDALSRVVQAVESTESQANTAVSGMLSGKTDVHDAMIALQRADLTLQFSVQIRNKLVQAYNEIMRMPV